MPYPAATVLAALRIDAGPASGKSTNGRFVIKLPLRRQLGLGSLRANVLLETEVDTLRLTTTDLPEHVGRPQRRQS